MGKWAQRGLAEKTPAPPHEGTDRTDRTPLLSVLTVRPGRVCDKSNAEAATSAALLAGGDSAARATHGDIGDRQASAAPAERQDLGGKPSHARTCADCLHLLRYGTCGEPVAAGLMPRFSIVWPPEGHAAARSAFSSKARTVAENRPHKLTKDEADRCHWPVWSEPEIQAFTHARADVHPPRRRRPATPTTWP